jgi:hypothetical protein
MNVELASFSEIRAGLDGFQFFETNDPKVPIMGRLIIGYAQGEPSDVSGEPSDDGSTQNLQNIVLEIGLEYTGNGQECEWYWEISVRDISTIKFLSKKHNTGYTATYKPTCRGCYCIPMELHGDTLNDFAPLVIEDITKIFKLDAN